MWLSFIYQINFLITCQVFNNTTLEFYYIYTQSGIKLVNSTILSLLIQKMYYLSLWFYVLHLDVGNSPVFDIFTSTCTLFGKTVACIRISNAHTLWLNNFIVKTLPYMYKYNNRSIENITIAKSSKQVKCLSTMI